MKLSELLPEQAANSSLEVTSITQDSRAISEGDLFFAVKGKSGSQKDGHLFIEQAFQKGAAAVVVEVGHPSLSKLPPSLLAKTISVPDTRQALSLASIRFFKNVTNQIKIFGITGTNGKTTSSYLLESLLSAAGLKPSLIGTVENRFENTVFASSLTTPDAFSLQKLFSSFYTQGARSVVMEVSSHALDQDRTWGVPFEAALFTNLTQDHLDYHGDMESYFQAKAKLFLEYETNHRIIHAADPWGKKLAQRCKDQGLPYTTFARSGADVNYESLKQNTNGTTGCISGIEIHSPLIGDFNIQNIAGVVAVGIDLGWDAATIQKGIENAKRVPGRLETISNPRGALVAVDYAHTPDALSKALQTLKQLQNQGSKLFCVFGCGGDRDATKRPLMGAVAEQMADSVWVTNDNPRTEDAQKILEDILKGMKNPKKAKVELDRKKAIEEALSHLQTNDVLLIAGKGHENYQIIGDQKLHFDDREIVRKFFDAHSELDS